MQQTKDAIAEGASTLSRQAGVVAAVATAALEAMPPAEAERVTEERGAIKLLSRGRTDGRLVAAITALHAAARVGVPCSRVGSVYTRGLL